jgi:hypothetical protein
MNERVAIYARVSTSRQEQEKTIASQIEAVEREVQAQGWSLPAERRYIDEGPWLRPVQPSRGREEGSGDATRIRCGVRGGPTRGAREKARTWPATSSSLASGATT